MDLARKFLDSQVGEIESTQGGGRSQTESDDPPKTLLLGRSRSERVEMEIKIGERQSRARKERKKELNGECRR